MPKDIGNYIGSPANPLRSPETTVRKGVFNFFDLVNTPSGIWGPGGATISPVASVTSAPDPVAGYFRYIFTGPATINIVGSLSVDNLLVVAGGGGGTPGDSSSHAGGGGGAGGYRLLTSVSETGPIDVVVGSGGATSTRGGPSAFGSIISTGGGSGPNPTAPGGSGRGTGITHTTIGQGNTPPVSPPQGNNGGPYGGGPGAAGGGGGATSIGGPTGGWGGSGGNATPITPPAYGGPGPGYPYGWFSGGGGGGGQFPDAARPGGNGGRGPGGVAPYAGGGDARGLAGNPAGSAGQANTGGGGGGGSTTVGGLAGGSGIVIMRTNAPFSIIWYYFFMIHIFDNFFEDPFKIREIALKSNFEKDSNGEWPGFRSTSPLDLSLLIKNRLETKLNLSLKLSSSDFQFIPKCYLTGICHSDSPRKYSSICYLNPNSPKTSGTEIFLNKSLYLNIKEKLEIIDNGSVNKIKYYNSNKIYFLKLDT